MGDRSPNKPPVRSGENFKAAHLGPWSEWVQYSEYHPKLKWTIEGRVFLKDLLGLTSSEISLCWFQAGTDPSVYHSHKLNEEIYIFIKGKGQMQVDGETFEVQECTAVRVSTPGVRVWRADPNEDLFFIVIQAREGSATSEQFNDGVLYPDKSVKW